MKLLIWIAFAVMASAWTALAWGTAELMQWAAAALGAGAGGWDVQAISLRIPAWLEPWVDMGWLLAVLDLLACVARAVQVGWPQAATVVGGLVAALGFTWGLGVLGLLALAAGLHALTRVATPTPASRASAS